MDDSSHDARTIFVANLSPDVSEEILYELFYQSGPIDDISIPKLDGKSRCFGFVTYSHESSVPYALKLYEGTELFRRKLVLKNRHTNNQNNSNRNSTNSSFNDTNSNINPLNALNIAPLMNSGPPTALMYGFNNLAFNLNPSQLLQQQFQQSVNMYLNNAAVNDLSMMPRNFGTSTPSNNNRNRDRERDRDEFVHRNRRNDRDRDRRSPYSRSGRDRDRRTRSRSPRRSPHRNRDRLNDSRNGRNGRR